MGPLLSFGLIEQLFRHSEGTPLSSLARGLDLMTLLAQERRPLGLGEIARKLEISKSSTHELLSTLAERGFVQRRDGGIYELGLKAWEVGRFSAY